MVGEVNGRKTICRYKSNRGKNMWSKVASLFRSKYGLLVLVALLLLLGGLVYGWLSHGKSSCALSSPSQEATEGFAATDTAQLMLFSADWCPHCQKCKPIWEDLKREYDGQTINGTRVTFVDVDCSDEENPEADRMRNKYEVDAYPTIKLVKSSGDVVTFDENPSRPALVQFLTNAI